MSVSASIAIIAKLSMGSGAALAAAEAPAAASGDAGALYAASGAVLVALIGGAVAVITSRNKTPPEPHVRYLDPPSSLALPQALSELYEDALERAVTAERERDLWHQRALEQGWKEPV